MPLRKSFRYRVYPSPEQEARLASWENSLRFLWNLAHEQRLLGLARPRGERRYYTAFDQQKELTVLRGELPWLADVPRHVCAQLLVALDLAWQRCLKKLARQPRWKRKGLDHVSVCETDPKGWYLDEDTLVFPKLGKVRAVVHRPLEGTPKRCTLVRDGDQWFAAISCERELPDPAPHPGPPVAIDLGVANLVADSTGRMVDNPRFLDQQARRLARAQRVVSRRKKGSNNQKRARLRVQRLHRTVRRQRDHLLHQVANHYAKNHGTVVVEKLEVRNMTRSARGSEEVPSRKVRQKVGLNRSILDAGWRRLLGLLRYKLAWAGGRLVEVRAAYSSQACAHCGQVAAENRRSQSEFVCTTCGQTDHADVNAARVLLSRGIHGGAACGGSAVVGRPVKQELRVARRGNSSSVRASITG